MKAAEFDKKFDDNEEDIIEYLDLSKARRPGIVQSNTQYVKKYAYYVVTAKWAKFFSVPVIHRRKKVKNES